MKLPHNYSNLREAEILKTALRTGRLSHAYLLEGGATGEKKAIVDEIAREIFSKTSDEHISFYENGIHPDYLKINAEDKEIKVEEVQDIISFLSSSPSYSDKRIIVIEDADKMNLRAMNKILKIIEEPPSYALFFLLTEIPDKLLATLKSRLTKLNFSLSEDAALSDDENTRLIRNFMKALKSRDLASCYTCISELFESKTDTLILFDTFETEINSAQESELDSSELKRYNLMMELLSECRYRLLTKQKPDLLLSALLSGFVSLILNEGAE